VAVVQQVQAAPAANDVEAFIKAFVAKHGVTARYRWSVDRENALLQAGQAWIPRMRDSDVVLKRKIMAHVRANDAPGSTRGGRRCCQ
jgi:hypothetical protein